MIQVSVIGNFSVSYDTSIGWVWTINSVRCGSGIERRRKGTPLLVQLCIGLEGLYLDLKGKDSQLSIKLNYYNRNIFLTFMKKNANNQVTIIFIVLLKEETTTQV